EEALSNTDADGGRVSLYEMGYNRFNSRLSRGVVAPEGVTAELEKAVHDNQEGLSANNLPQTQGNRVNSILIAPILYEGFVAGLISLHSLKKDCFDTQTEMYLQALANHAAIAIGNAKRFDELNSRGSELYA